MTLQEQESLAFKPDSELVVGFTSPQSEFERKYISSTEICEEMGVTRAAVMVARRSGKLPGAIEINQGRLFMWERDFIRPFIEAWKASRQLT